MIPSGASPRIPLGKSEGMSPEIFLQRFLDDYFQWSSRISSRDFCRNTGIASAISLGNSRCIFLDISQGFLQGYVQGFDLELFFKNPEETFPYFSGNIRWDCSICFSRFISRSSFKNSSTNFVTGIPPGILLITSQKILVSGSIRDFPRSIVKKISSENPPLISWGLILASFQALLQE